MGTDEVRKCDELLKLRGLEVMKGLNNKTIDQIKSDSSISHNIDIFETQTIRTIILRNWGEENLLYTIFNRINTGTEKLSPQELRMSLYPGKFMQFINHNSYFEEIGKLLKIDKPDKRMRDVELIIRYFSFFYFYKEYNGRLRQFFDNTAKKLNIQSNDSSEFEKIELQFEQFKKTLNLMYDIFEDNYFRVFDVDRGEYSKQFNKASFDVLMYFGSDKQLFDILSNPETKDKFKKCYEDMFRDPKIVEDYKSHTTDLDKVDYRFNKFNSLLFEEFNISVL